MGRDKASLLFGPGETLLQRVVRVVAECVPGEHIVCVASHGQALPELPGGTRVLVDREPDRGPLAALQEGLRGLTGSADRAFVCGCDAPLLRPAFVTRMLELLGDADIAAPHDGERWQPLAGVYHTRALSSVDKLLASGERSLQALCNSCDARRVSLDEIRAVDAELLSLASCNTPEDYHAARRQAETLQRAPLQ
jgi:molybdopterin-guanine dinucleotide biosynthesis protein A